MKTKLTLTVILLLWVVISYGQKIQIKDGVILRDKEPVAKLEGEAKLFKGTYIKIKSLNDELLISIEGKMVNYGSHFQDPLQFTKITFIPFKETIYRLDMQFTSEKKILNFLYDRIGKDFLTKDGLNKDKIVAFSFDNDHAEKIQEDSIKFGRLISKYLDGLKQPVQPRDRSMSIVFSSFSNDKLNWDGYIRNSEQYFDRSFQAIYQDNALLGVLVKEMIKGSMTAPDYNAAQYYVLRKIKPFQANGETFEYAPLAFLKSSSLFGTQIKIENQGMRDAPKIADFGKAESTLLYTLIQEGLL